MIQVISLIGQQGSGKTTIGTEVAVRLGTKYVETSAIVKKANAELDDLQLAKSAERNIEEPTWLTDALEREIRTIAEEHLCKTVVVGGSREPVIYDMFQNNGWALWSIWMKADPFIRFNRLMKQGRINSAGQFLTRELNERDLGLRELHRVTQYEAETSDMIYPTETAKTIIHFLKEKGLET